MMYISISNDQTKLFINNVNTNIQVMKMINNEAKALHYNVIELRYDVWL